MLEAVIGDIVGQPYELYNIKSRDFNLIGDANLYTDDTVMTIWIMLNKVDGKIRKYHSNFQ